MKLIKVSDGLYLIKANSISDLEVSIQSQISDYDYISDITLKFPTIALVSIEITTEDDGDYNYDDEWESWIVDKTSVAVSDAKEFLDRISCGYKKLSRGELDEYRKDNFKEKMNNEK